MSNNNTPHAKYDVFVSFRGEDIRHDFLSHLVKAFPREQINAFVDDKLKRGDDISDSLIEAIEGSSISLVIFSENYATSRWCLAELAKIIERKENYEQIVIPVFYGVDPTDVRHQTKSYENAFSELEKRYNLSEVETWRRALKISANLSGIRSSSFRNDADLLQEIINNVSMRLSKPPINSKGLVGIDKSISHLKSLLQKESKKARVIGIWGMGGIGKTTISEEIFKQIYSEYQGYCFLAKVSEEIGKHGITSIKEKLFSKLLVEDVKIDSPNGLSDYIRRRIGHMKVLIVLDDVKETNQLEMLFGTLDWFPSDSRIIVTSRDRQVLIANEVDEDDLYKVGELDSSEALELFNLNAFKKSHLETEFYDVSKRMVHYAKGVPLVLKVLANMLRGKEEKEDWESQLDKLKRMPIKEVHGIMRLSYDDLDRLEQKYFLDIACFFNGLNLKVDYVKLLLKDNQSDNSVAVGLKRLQDKALITISEDNVISMHDILQEMGREVVRQESSEDPNKRSRLWDHDEICDVLKNDKGTDAIRSICLDLSAIRKLKLSPHVFAKISKLLFLDFRGEYIQDCLIFPPQGLQSLPTDLRYLYWMHCPLKSFPENFSTENLVILNLFASQMEKLWCGVQDLVNLKEVTLSHSKYLKELPDFSKATNLKVMNLRGCDKLKSIHPSIFSLDKLEHLDLSHCFSLTTFTSNSNLSSLHYLNLGGCRQLSKFSVPLENIVELQLWGCRINALPSSIGCLSNLETLNLSDTEIEIIHSSIKNFTRLRKLNIECCRKLLALPELPSSVKILLVDKCKSLKTVLFPSTVAEQSKENKKRIEFWNCSNLDELSLINIGLNLQMNLMQFTHQHLSTLEHDDYVESYVDYSNNYDSHQALYAYPGSSVPEWLEYKTTKNDMIIDLSQPHRSPLLGFVFCFVIAKDFKLLHCRIKLKITRIEGDIEKDGVDIYLPMPFDIDSDHVCMIYNQQCSQYLTRIAKNQTSFKIKVTAWTTPCVYDEGQKREVKLKGFGMSPINHSTYDNLIQQMEYNWAESERNKGNHVLGIGEIKLIQDRLDFPPQELQSFPSDLRYLHWEDCPLKSFPKKFSAENLVILNLFASQMEKLWCGVQDLVNLKEVTLSGSKYLKELPDFSKATNLKVMNLRGCDKLKSIHPSIFSLDKLEHLDLSCCFSLTRFTSNSHLSSLHYLNLGGCRQLSKFSVTLENIVELQLWGCRINALPSSIGCQSNLESLVLSDSKIESIPSSIKNLTRLRKLDIQCCRKLLALPQLPSSIETLLVEDCKSLKTVLFPSTVAEQSNENKKRIEFWNCSNLDELSLRNIGLNLQINLMKFTHQHLSTLEHDDYVESYVVYRNNYDSHQALYVYPGSSVPEWLEYKTTMDNMIIDLSQPHLSPLLGFVFCFVIAKDFKLYFKIKLKITTIEGGDETDGVDIWLRIPWGIHSDHVCMIYNQPCSQYLTRIAKNQTSFKIKVTAWSIPFVDEEQRREAKLKGFGMSPINHSTYHNLIQQMEYECAEGEGKNNTVIERKKEIKEKEGATKQSVLGKVFCFPVCHC